MCCYCYWCWCCCFAVLVWNNSNTKHLTLQLFGCYYFISFVSHPINLILIHIHHNHVQYAQCTCAKHKLMKKAHCSICVLTLLCTKRLDKTCDFLNILVSFYNCLNYLTWFSFFVYRFWLLVLLVLVYKSWNLIQETEVMCPFHSLLILFWLLMNETDI